MSIIVIDPGHGGDVKVGGSSPNNARGPSGVLEKTLTLAIARRLVPVLEARGHRALLTRDRDVNLGLAARAHVARERKADAFISIHFNGFNGRTQGTETFAHARASGPSTALAKLVQQFALAVTQHPDRGVKRAEFGVLSPAQHHVDTAACLVELSFMDVPQEDQRLGQDAYQQGIAEGLAAALQAYSQQSFAVGFAPAPDEAPEDGYEELVR
jgi:N-acetylmuramoyl-L-alanine amidase